MTGEIRIIKYNSDWYQQEVALRYKILREPLGLNFTAGQLAAEDKDIHVAYIEHSQVLGCLVLSPLDARHLKMRQVAMDETMQGKGIGSAMVRFSENYAAENGYEWIVCSARKTAVPFYLNQGWQTIGDEFIEVTIPHFKMQKKILDSRSKTQD